MSSSFNIPRFCFVMNIQQSIHFPSDIEKRPKRNSLGRIYHPCYHLNSENSLCTHVNTGNHNDYPILLPCNVGTDVEVYSDHVTVKAFFQKHDQPFIFSVHCSEATSINPSRKLTAIRHLAWERKPKQNCPINPATRKWQQSAAPEMLP